MGSQVNIWTDGNQAWLEIAGNERIVLSIDELDELRKTIVSVITHLEDKAA